MSSWTKFATKFYQQQKKKNPDYKFSQALKDGAKLYKKGGNDKYAIPPSTAVATHVATVKETDATQADAINTVEETKSTDTDATDTDATAEDATAKDATAEDATDPVVKETDTNATAATDTDTANANLEQVDLTKSGGKKSAKKGKKSVKKGGKKGKKSAKKGGKKGKKGKKSAKKSRR